MNEEKLKMMRSPLIFQLKKVCFFFRSLGAAIHLFAQIRFFFCCFSSDKLVRISVTACTLQRLLSHPLSCLIDINRVRALAIILHSLKWSFVFFTVCREQQYKK